MKKRVVLAMLLVTLFLGMIGSSIYAQALQVQIGVPSSSNDLGINSSSGLTSAYWVGQFPVTINYGTSQATTGEVYCMNANGQVYVGGTYNAAMTPVPNTSTWQQIGYILSWNAPTTNVQAAVDQVAIWMLLNQQPSSYDFTLDSSITTAAQNIVNTVTANGGVNVALAGDHLQWISPFVGVEGSANTTSANPGVPVTFTLKLTDSQGNPVPNAQIDFAATITSPGVTTATPLSAPYISSSSAFTDSSGIAQVTVTAPAGTTADSKIAVTASTQSTWPVEYLDLTDQTGQGNTQDLIGIGQTLLMTTSFNVNISGSIFVMPESAYGALSAVVAFAAAFLMYYKLKPQAKQPKL